MYIRIGTYSVSDTGIQKAIVDFYNAAYEEFNDRVDVVRNREIFGMTPLCPYYDKANDINYLLGMLIMIWWQKSYDTDNNRGYDNQYYWTTYKLEDIRHYFQCQGYNIIPLIETFGLGL